MNPLDGTMNLEAGTAPTHNIQDTPTLDTLDEPVMDTICRDLKRIVTKTRHVLVPGSNGLEALRDWDLWGPLLLCLVLAVTLSVSAGTDQTALAFATVFVVVWCGSGIVTLNALLLGGKVSFFQCVCVLGYCIAPLNIASILALAWSNIIFKIVLVCFCFFWSVRASVGFMSQLLSPTRKALGVYPIFLFYLVISWMVVVQ
jgi:hypothetical protein